MNLNQKLTTRDKLSRARMVLADQHPFFAYLALQLTIQEKKDLPMPTMGVTEEGSLFYHPDYVESLKEKELLFAMCHEVMHVAFQHTTKKKRGGRDPMVWNLAGDFVINAMLKRNNIGDMPSGLLFDPKYDNNLIEEVYDDIIKNAKKIKGQPMMGGKGCYVEGKDKGGGSGKEAEGEGIDWGSKLQEAAVTARQKGKLPVGMDRLIEAMSHEPLSWRDVLQRKFQRHVYSFYSYKRPSRRSSDDMILPKMEKAGVDLVVAIDTSGSIGTKELSMFYHEIKAMQESVPGTRMKVLTIDADVHEVADIESYDDLKEKINFKGGGGSDMRPAFKFVERLEQKPDMIIVLTDGFVEFPEKDVGVDTIWVSCADQFKVPFGDVVKMKNYVGGDAE